MTSLQTSWQKCPKILSLGLTCNTNRAKKAISCIVLGRIGRTIMGWINQRRKGPSMENLTTCRLKYFDDVFRKHRVSLLSSNLRCEVRAVEYAEAGGDGWESSGEAEIHP